MSTATTTKPTVADRIAHLRPCEDAAKWAAGYTSPAKAWKECTNGSWMLWLCGKLSGPPEGEGRKKLVLCACECARLALPRYAKCCPHDDRVVKCIETAERWARGEATIEQLRKARAADASAAAARAKALAECAAIVRKHYPEPPVMK